MFKKFNWGWGLALTYSSFVAFMLFMVWQSTVMKTELVTSDYYGKELKYQEQLNKMKRAGSLGDTISWTVNSKQVMLNFPKQVVGKNVKADVLFYKPDNSLRDFNVSCHPDSTGSCLIASDKFHHGVYKMEIDWSAGGQTYYTEGIININ
jgi:nitrogen fixation protein FixH